MLCTVGRGAVNNTKGVAKVQNIRIIETAAKNCGRFDVAVNEREVQSPIRSALWFLVSKSLLSQNSACKNFHTERLLHRAFSLQPSGRVSNYRKSGEPNTDELSLPSVRLGRGEIQPRIAGRENQRGYMAIGNGSKPEGLKGWQYPAISRKELEGKDRQ